jgi:hypothetical protein
MAISARTTPKAAKTLIMIAVAAVMTLQAGNSG